MINWTENKTIMMITPLIIIDPDPGQCLAPHILPGARLSQAAELKGSKMNVRRGGGGKKEKSGLPKKKNPVA